MEFVQTTLETLNFLKIEQRTYFKIICNIEMTIRMAMGLKTMSRSFRLTGKQPYSFLQQLRNWAADKLLEMDYQDFQMLEKIAPYILYIVNHTGTCHEDIAMQFMEGFIRKVESRMLSDVALREISAEEARRKPMSKRTLSQTGTTIITNSGFIKLRQAKLRATEDEKVRKTALSVQPDRIAYFAMAIGLTMSDEIQKQRCYEQFTWRSKADKTAKQVLFLNANRGNWLEEKDYLNFKLTCKDAIKICDERHTETFLFPTLQKAKEERKKTAKTTATATAAVRPSATTIEVESPMTRKDIVCQTCGFIRQLPKGVYFRDISTPGSWTCHQACWDPNTKCGEE
jgi:hypothetical protein